MVRLTDEQRLWLRRLAIVVCAGIMLNVVVMVAIVSLDGLDLNGIIVLAMTAVWAGLAYHLWRRP